MGKGELVRASERAEQAVRAIAMRREGIPYVDIAVRLGVTTLEAQELARVAYGQLAEQTADELRVETEDRIDEVVRKANRDLALCSSQGERTALYRVILAAEGQRARLLGLNLKGGGDDADA